MKQRREKSREGVNLGEKGREMVTQHVVTRAQLTIVDTSTCSEREKYSTLSPFSPSSIPVTSVLQYDYVADRPSDGAHGLQHSSAERTETLRPPARLGGTDADERLRGIRGEDPARLLRRRTRSGVGESGEDLRAAAHDRLQRTEPRVGVRGVLLSRGGQGVRSSAQQLLHSSPHRHPPPLTDPHLTHLHPPSPLSPGHQGGNQTGDAEGHRGSCGCDSVPLGCRQD